jgi:hypothetical protein
MDNLLDRELVTEQGSAYTGGGSIMRALNDVIVDALDHRWFYVAGLEVNYKFILSSSVKDLCDYIAEGKLCRSVGGDRMTDHGHGPGTTFPGITFLVPIDLPGGPGSPPEPALPFPPARLNNGHSTTPLQHDRGGVYPSPSRSFPDIVMDDEGQIILCPVCERSTIDRTGRNLLACVSCGHEWVGAL